MAQLIYSCAKCALLYRMSQKNEPLFVKYFLGDYKLKIIETLNSNTYTVIQVYSFTVHFYIISTNLVANYASIAKLKKDISKNLVSQEIYSRHSK